jgi:uncharacterized protein Yka (UPF0111/DUF47 family)
MNDDQLDDLKQFIVATVSQYTADMATKEDVANMATKQDVHQLIAKLDDLELKVDTISDTLNEQLNEQDSRLTKLEHKLA